MTPEEERIPGMGGCCGIKSVTSAPGRISGPERSLEISIATIQRAGAFCMNEILVDRGIQVVPGVGVSLVAFIADRDLWRKTR
jgi:hypothetical protein